NGGTIHESAAGSLTLPNLRVSSTGAVDLTRVNNVGALAASTTNGFSFSNGTHSLTIGIVDGVTGIQTTNSSIDLIADNLDIQQALNAGSGAAGGTVLLEPFTSSLLIDLGTPSVFGTTFGVTDVTLNLITAG